MSLTLVNQQGELHDLERYDAAKNRLIYAGVEGSEMAWLDITLLCDDKGTDAVATDVERKGSSKYLQN